MARKNNLVKNASILMIAIIVARVIGLLYRRPLGQILGTVGLGYYGYASNLYTILLLISSFSIPTALSKIISEKMAKGEYRNSQKIFKGALLYAVIIGGIFALIAFFGGRILLPGNQANAIPALKVLAPTIFLSAVLGVLRGYFQAHKNMTPTSVSQVIEQIFNAIVSIAAALILIKTLAPEGGTGRAVWGAVGGTMGTGAGVLFGLLFMWYVYGVNRKTISRIVARDVNGTEDSYTDIFKLILIVVTPIIITSFINNASTYLDAYLYSALQGRAGIDSDVISAAYGEYSNYYIPLINIPLALAAASVAAMMPEVSSSYAVQRMEDANNSVGTTIRLTMFVCLPSTVGLTVLSSPIMKILFPASTDLSAKLLLTGSLYVVFAALSTITSGVLQAIGRQKEAMINAGISLGINLVFQTLVLLAVPKLDIYSVMISNILFSVVLCVVNDLSLKKHLGFRNELRLTYAMPLLASAVMAAAAAGIYYGLHILTKQVFLPLVIAILAGVIVYLVMYAVFTRIPENQLRTFPMGSKMVKILKFLHVYQ
ncbi:MAG: polysaccharide biosynthesis protein [Lachnospiraceae bacterium]|nr:polysaccharide biosynthesis protein [Lachnospiraceae bacterium]